MQNTAQTTDGAKKRVGKSVKIDVPLSERAAYSPNEFAALFGKQTTWGYRQLYRGRVRAIKSMGRIMIPRGEVTRLQSELATVDELLEQQDAERGARLLNTQTLLERAAKSEGG